MSEINKQGNVVARCPGCDGGKSTFEYSVNGKDIGHVLWRAEKELIRYQLFRCAGCGRGGLGQVKLMNVHGGAYPTDIWQLLNFFPEAKERLPLPKDIPAGIQHEFREAEACLENRLYRAAAALFRSVLDKTMRANGYKTEQAQNLKKQIDQAAADGVITPTRQLRAHEDVRVMGNDVLHDEWHKLELEDVEPAHHYVQRILEDFYDDRASVLKQLRAANRTPDEDKKQTAPNKAT